MKSIVKFRWAVLALWLAVVAGLVLTAPNMADLVREKGQITVPDGYTSTNAGELLHERDAQRAGDEEGAGAATRPCLSSTATPRSPTRKCPRSRRASTN